MQTASKLTLLCAAALMTAFAGVTPASAQYGYANQRHPTSLSAIQRSDYKKKRADIKNEWASVRQKQHQETEMFHAEDARLHQEDIAYRAAHHGYLSPQLAAKLDRERTLDKERELTAQHRATYKAQFNDLRATRRYDDQKARLLLQQGR